MRNDATEPALYVPSLVPRASIAKKSWIEQFFPFLANPLFIIRLAVYGPFINPTIRPLSGLINADKGAILRAFPESIRGTMIVFDGAALPDAGMLPYPCYVKPVFGERSVNVHRIDGPEDFLRLVDSGLLAQGSWIAQEAFLGTEFGVNIVRDPRKSDTLSVAFLTEKQVHAHAHTASIASGAIFREVLNDADPHALACCAAVLKGYLDASPLLNDFHAGRFDLKASDLDALLAGEFKLIELNGIGGMPLAYFGDTPYAEWNSYFLTLLAIGKKNIRRFSFTKRISRIAADVPRAIMLIFRQKHFREYWRLPRR